ncbi:hypothetical protein AB0L00_38640 [Actinoallomurus sp. NPDC052308]
MDERRWITVVGKEYQVGLAALAGSPVTLPDHAGSLATVEL